MPKVFIVQEVKGRNIEAAYQFGDPEFILSYAQNIEPWNTLNITQQIITALKDFEPEDYILAMGDPVAIGIACVVAARKTQGHWRMLKWDRRDRQYLELILMIENWDGI